MKQLYIVSTGRCGTKRLMEILREVLPANRFVVEHQTGISRLANVLGNMMYRFGGSERIRRCILNRIRKRNAKDKHFICTDPLISMVLPDDLIEDPDVMIVHLRRDAASFSESFFRLSRGRWKSFIAHNFIPFWQPGVWPMENIFGRHIRKKYRKVWARKNDFFERRYSKNPNYRRMDMNEIFRDGALAGLVEGHFSYRPHIGEKLLRTRSNQSAVSH